MEVGLTIPEMVGKWVLSNEAITCALVGSRNILELEANVKVIRDPLGKDLKSELDRITLRVKQKLGNHFDYYESVANDRIL